MTNNFPGVGYKTQGVDFNYFQQFTITNTTFGGQSIDGYQPSDIIRFPTYSVIFINTGSTPVNYSFNGTTLHGIIGASGTPTGFLEFNNRVISLMWFSVSSGSGSIQVHAWGIR